MTNIPSTSGRLDLFLDDDIKHPWSRSTQDNDGEVMADFFSRKSAETPKRLIDQTKRRQLVETRKRLTEKWNKETEMSKLDQINRTKTKRGRAIVLHGDIGIGKTEFTAAAIEETTGLMIHHKKEQGINDLKESGDVSESLATYEFDTYTDITEILTELAAEDESDQFNVIGIDSLTWLERECYKYVCEKEFRGDFSTKGFYDYWAGPRAAAERHWPHFIDLLERNVQLGRTVICIAHTKQKDEHNADGNDYTKNMPEMDRDSFKLFTIWAKHVIFMTFVSEVEKVNARAKGKVLATGRYMKCVGHPTYIAKSKGLPDEISMGQTGKEAWANFTKAENTKNAESSVTKKKIVKKSASRLMKKGANIKKKA
jgi:hypothetical protein